MSQSSGQHILARTGTVPLSLCRVDANAHRKNLILKSCQDLIEVLHYHACDSSSSPGSEYMKCLLNLQVQHVSARFAVYLTGEGRLQAPPRQILSHSALIAAAMADLRCG